MTLILDLASQHGVPARINDVGGICLLGSLVGSPKYGLMTSPKSMNVLFQKRKKRGKRGVLPDVCP